MRRIHGKIIASSFGLVACIATAAPQPLENFARMPQMRDVSISPDGRYVAFISAVDDASVVMTFDAHANGTFQRVAASDPGRFDVETCGWANEERVICSLTGNIRGRRYAEPPFFRTMAVDASGASIKTLDVSSQKGNLLAGTTSMQNLHVGGNTGALQPNGTGGQDQGGSQSSSSSGGPGGSSSGGPGGSSSGGPGGSSSGGPGGSQASPGSQSNYSFVDNGAQLGNTVTRRGGQRTDLVIDTAPNDKERILIQTNAEGRSFPSVVSLNVYTGAREVRARASPPIRQFLTDAHGNVRFGWGISGRLNASYFTRKADKMDWTQLSKLAAFSGDQVLAPVGIAPSKNIVYALGDFEGRKALWTIDLTDQREPEVLLKHAIVDLTTPMLTNDKRFIGVRYDLDRPMTYYSDETLRDTVKQINAQFTTRLNMVVDMTADEGTLVIRSFSDVDYGTYYLFDRQEKKMKRLGQAYPELKADGLGTMKAITYKAADGTEVHGYLTTPNRQAQGNLPLVVLPHDGPDQRDSWQFSFFRTFLANRGYAVLQMNYRGSAGYGREWMIAGRGNWAGISYSDIVDGTRWAVSQGIADPKRICIAGWGFGGYAALLGAARNSDLYQCSISINGISDLKMLRDNASMFGPAEEAYVDLQVGSDKDKLAKDSPSELAKDMVNPVLLVHGEFDWQVQVDQSKEMESALKKQKKDYKAVYIKGAGHELDRKSDRMTLLKEVEDFLKANLGAGAT